MEMLFMLDSGEIVSVADYDEIEEAWEYLEEATGMTAKFIGYAPSEEVENMGIDTY